MNRSSVYGAGLLILFLGSNGCSAKHEVFATEHIREHQLSEADIAVLQFYTTGPVVLQRLEVQRNRSTSGHELEARRVERREQIAIEDGTPGIASDVGGSYVELDVGEGVFLRFDSRGRGGDYVLMGVNGSSVGERLSEYPGSIEWRVHPAREPSILPNRGAAVIGGVEYGVYYQGPVFLKFDLDELNQVVTDRKTIKGRRH